MTPDKSNYYGPLTADELNVLEEFGAKDLMHKFGGNGSGMTRNLLTPLARKLLAIRAAERRRVAGNPNA